MVPFAKGLIQMFERKFNNCSIVGAKRAGVVKSPVRNKNTGYKYREKLRQFLNEYQYGYNEGRCLPDVPPELRALLERLKFLFRLERDNIENIIKAACRIRLPKKPRKQNRKHKTKRK